MAKTKADYTVVERMYKLRKQGLTFEEIGEKLERHPDYVYQMLVKRALRKGKQNGKHL